MEVIIIPLLIIIEDEEEDENERSCVQGRLWRTDKQKTLPGSRSLTANGAFQDFQDIVLRLGRSRPGKGLFWGSQSQEKAEKKCYECAPQAPAAF